MGKISDTTKIAGKFTVKEWKEFRQTLLDFDNENLKAWENAFSIFEQRIETRFLKPIRRILSIGKLEGEGFSAAALQCILVEFLEAFYQGKIYTPTRTEDELENYAKRLGTTKEELENQLQPNEYNSSAKLFRDFLTGHLPFRNEFTPPLANTFYKKIRCGLLHEAATKGGTTIKGKGASLIQTNGNDLVLFRTKFQEALDEFVKSYKQELLVSQERKKAFIRKMDDICQLDRRQYFAYGSNMHVEQLINRVGFIYDKSSGFVNNYSFSYNKKSKDGSSKANLIRSDGNVTHGVCFEIDSEGFQKLQKIEKGYNEIEIPFYSKAGTLVIVKTFMSNSNWDAPPTEEYVNTIIQGARENHLPEEYIEMALTYGSAKSVTSTNETSNKAGKGQELNLPGIE